MNTDELIFPLGTKHPEKCPIHHEDVVLNIGRYGPYYRCKVYGCKVVGSAHGDGRPMGKLSTPEVAGQRITVHQMLNVLKKHKDWYDDQIYAWLKELFHSNKMVHISDLGTKELRKVLREINKILKA